MYFFEEITLWMAFIPCKLLGNFISLTDYSSLSSLQRIFVYHWWRYIHLMWKFVDKHYLTDLYVNIESVCEYVLIMLRQGTRYFISTFNGFHIELYVFVYRLFQIRTFQIYKMVTSRQDFKWRTDNFMIAKTFFQLRHFGCEP